MNRFELNGVTYNVTSDLGMGSTTTYTVHCSQRVGGRAMFVLQYADGAWVESQQLFVLRQAEPDVLDFLLSGGEVEEGETVAEDSDGNDEDDSEGADLGSS